MAIELVLNELSLFQCAADAYVGRERIELLIQTLRHAVRLGAQRALRGPADLFEIELAPGYRLGDWRQDQVVDIERRRYLSSFVSKLPFLVDLPAQQEDALLKEFRYRGARAEGLGVALLLDGIGISNLSHEEWDTERIESPTPGV